MLIQEHALLVWIVLSVKSHLNCHFILFVSLLTPDSRSAKSCTRLERYSKVAHHRNTDNVWSLSGQVHLSHPQQFVCPLSLDCSFWVLHFILLPWQPSLSESPTSLVPFRFHFLLSLKWLSSFCLLDSFPTLSCTITVTLSFPLFRLTLVFFSFSPP